MKKMIFPTVALLAVISTMLIFNSFKQGDGPVIPAITSVRWEQSATGSLTSVQQEYWMKWRMQLNRNSGKNSNQAPVVKGC